MLFLVKLLLFSTWRVPVDRQAAFRLQCALGAASDSEATTWY